MFNDDIDFGLLLCYFLAGLFAVRLVWEHRGRWERARGIIIGEYYFLLPGSFL
jgi:hypothetical protein